jgi:hypothetical protein
MTIPHQFPSLVDGPAQVVLIAGSGLSRPIVPMLRELRGKLEEVARPLAASAAIAPSDDRYDYALAGAVIEKLQAGGKTESESRLWLAEELGMLDDRRWFGEVGLPLSGNTPRHRALARFAVEKRLRAIVSLNWDALLEAALDSVGLTQRAGSPRPWEVTAYASVVDDKDMPLVGHGHVFPVVKPHGCVRELERARTQLRLGASLGPITFKLTLPELSELNLAQKQIFNTTVGHYLAACPVIGIGWSASEPYLRTAIVGLAKAVQRSERDAFTVIDICWNTNHTEIAAAYGKSEGESFAEVKKETHPSADCLLQWLQARHALNRMIVMAPAAERAPLEDLLQELKQPDCNHPAQSWADYWLPTWVRLCWRAGAMQGVDPQTNRMIGPFEIPITPRDAHIPLTGMSTERRDLHAASKLLVALRNSLGRFRFDLYPGGLLDMHKNCLYLPLPGWKAAVPPSDLAALKPLVEALRSGLGYVRKLHLLWLNNKDEPPDRRLRHELEAQIRSLMPLVGFAHGDALSWVDLEVVSGDSRAAVA